MSPEEIIVKLKTNKEKIRNRLAFSEHHTNLFDNLAKNLNIAKQTIEANDNDFYAYVIARLSGKV